MGALMLIFALSVAGESGTMALQFESLAQCEDTRGTLVQAISESPTPSGSRVMYIAAVCVVPAKVETS